MPRLVNRDLTARLARWLGEGGKQIGQIVITSLGDSYELRHRDDAGRTDLGLFTRWEEARSLATADDAGKFRALKTAPNLRHGWRLVLRETAEVRKALDYFYPAMLGVAESFSRQELPAVPLRITLERQTGMYAITKKITSAQARGMIDRFCAGCLKQRLWEIAGPHPVPPSFAPAEFPLLCHEACNLLVAEARKVVKQP